MAVTTPPLLIALLEYSTRPAAPQVRALLDQMRVGDTYRAAVIEVLGRLATQSSPAAIYRPSSAPQVPNAPVPNAPTPQSTTSDDALLGVVARLRIGNSELTAHSQQPLRVGQQLQVQVARTEPLVELRVLDQAPRLTAREALIQNALPRQVPLRELYTALREQLPVALERPRPGAPAALPLAARPLAEHIAARPIPVDRVSPQTVQDSVRSSGLFLDQALLAGRIPAPDLKLDLLRLLRVIQPSQISPKPGTEPPPVAPQEAGARGMSEGQGLIDRLLRLLEGGVARVQMQQAASLPQEQGGRQVWQLDIPILAGHQVDEVQVRVERDQASDTEAGDEGDGAEWRVELHFEFDSIGAVHARLSMRGDTVSTLFWCQKPQTERLIGAQIPQLEAALKSAGLEIGRMAAMTGEAPDPIDLPKPDRGLLDARA